MFWQKIFYLKRYQVPSVLHVSCFIGNFLKRYLAFVLLIGPTGFSIKITSFLFYFSCFITRPK